MVFPWRETVQLFTVTTVSHSLYTASSDCQCMTNVCRSLELKSGFDEQAGDRFWLFFRIPPTVGVREAKSTPFESETENVLQCVRFTTRSSEEKLHWTRSRIPTCCHTVDTRCSSTPLCPTHRNVTTSVNRMSLYDFYEKKKMCILILCRPRVLL